MKAEAITMAVLLFAQASDPVTGGAGWVGAGLLGLVLSWLLLKHLPERDRQLKELIDGKDALISLQNEKHESVIREVASRHDAIVKDLTATFAAQAREQRQEFRAALDQITAAMREEFAKIHRLRDVAAEDEYRERTARQNEALMEQETKARRPK